MRTTALVLLATLAATAAGCGGSGSSADPSLPAPTPSATASVVPGLAAGDAQALRARLIAFPPGITSLLVPGTVDGGLGLDAYVAYRFGTETTAEQAAERASLAAAGFQLAVERHWTGPGPQITSLELVEFADAAGAEQQLRVEDAAYASSAAFRLIGTSSAFGGETFSSRSKDSSHYFQTLATGAVDNIDVLVQEYADPAPDETSIQELLAQQARSVNVTPSPSPSPSS